MKYSSFNNGTCSNQLTHLIICSDVLTICVSVCTSVYQGWLGSGKNHPLSLTLEALMPANRPIVLLLLCIQRFSRLKFSSARVVNFNTKGKTIK